MSEQPAGKQNPVFQFVAEHKILVIIVVLAIVGLSIFTFGQKGDDKEPSAQPTIQSTAQLGDGTSNSTTPPTSAPPLDSTDSSSVGATAGPGPATAPTPAPSPSATPHVVGNGPQAPERANWKPAAEAFSVAWANGEGGKKAWLKRMKPYITEELAANFEATIMQNVYTDTFENMNTLEEHNAYVIFETSYEKNGMLIKGLIQLQGTGEWLVDSIAPADE